MLQCRERDGVKSGFSTGGEGDIVWIERRGV